MYIQPPSTPSGSHIPPSSLRSTYTLPLLTNPSGQLPSLLSFKLIIPPTRLWCFKGRLEKEGWEGTREKGDGRRETRDRETQRQGDGETQIQGHRETVRQVGQGGQRGQRGKGGQGDSENSETVRQ